MKNINYRKRIFLIPYVKILTDILFQHISGNNQVTNYNVFFCNSVVNYIFSFWINYSHGRLDHCHWQNKDWKILPKTNFFKNNCLYQANRTMRPQRWHTHMCRFFFDTWKKSFNYNILVSGSCHLIKPPWGIINLVVYNDFSRWKEHETETYHNSSFFAQYYNIRNLVFHKNLFSIMMIYLGL